MKGALPGRQEVEAAAGRLAGRVRTTPVLAVEPGALGLAGGCTLKLEIHQHTGSFKVRGAFNRLLAAAPGAADAGVVAASGGNHGLAVAHAARALGLRAEVFVPSTTPAVKVDGLRAYGADVVVVPGYYPEALAASAARAAGTGALVVHAYDQPEVVAGQGTVARELDAQAPGLDTVVVAVGGGGLLAGCAAWFGGRVRLVAVEPEAAPTLHAALAAGQPVDAAVGGVAADSLGAGRVGAIAFGLASGLGNRLTSVLVDDGAILEARRALWDEARVAAEAGGAAALAGLRAGAYRPAPGERVGVVVCGANTDPATLA